METTPTFSPEAISVRGTAVIGIDPDAIKSGIAVLYLPNRTMHVATLTFPDLIAAVQEESTIRPVKVYVEAGWLNRSNWHTRYTDTPALAAKKGEAVGRNQETGRKIFEMLKHLGIDVELIKPLPLRIGRTNLWRGKDGKITHEELVAMTGLKQKRTNQEERDAALIAWRMEGLPINIAKTLPWRGK